MPRLELVGLDRVMIIVSLSSSIRSSVIRISKAVVVAPAKIVEVPSARV